MDTKLAQHFTYGKLLKFVFPSIVMMVFTSIYCVVDGLFVSNFVGKTAFASINLIMPFIMGLTALGFMMGTGGSAIVAKTLGEGKPEKANEYFSLIVYTTIIGGLILSILGMFLVRPVSILLGAEGELLENCVLYGRITFISLTAFMLQNVFQSFFATLDEYIKNYSQFYIFVGSIVTNMQDMHKSYAYASSLDTLSFFKDYNSVIYFEEVPHKTCATIDSNAYSDFKRNLNNEDKQAVLNDINNITSEFMLNCGTDINEIKNVYNKFLMHIFNFCHSRNINLNNSVNENTNFNAILQFNNIFEIKHYLLEIIKDVFSCLKEKDIYNEPALNIIKYINEHYNSYDLSLEDISKNTFLTPAYICVIFKDYTGKTVNKYITEYRIIQAKELLKDSNIKMNDIALKVGYKDGNYFAKIFKKETSYTPSEYRRKFL